MKQEKGEIKSIKNELCPKQLKIMKILMTKFISYHKHY